MVLAHRYNDFASLGPTSSNRSQNAFGFYEPPHFTMSEAMCFNGKKCPGKGNKLDAIWKNTPRQLFSVRLELSIKFPWIVFVSILLYVYYKPPRHGLELSSTKIWNQTNTHLRPGAQVRETIQVSVRHLKAVASEFHKMHSAIGTN